MIEYGYLIVSLIFLLVWFLIYLRANCLRRPMLVLSMITMLFGPISEFWYFTDYWRPNLVLRFPIGGVEDLIFGFSIGGIAAFSYETLFVNHICYCKRKKLAFEWFLLLFAVVEGLAMVVFNNILKINSIFASSTGMILAAIFMLYIRRDLVVNALASGVLVAIIMFVIYLIPQILFPQAHYFMQRYWLLYGRPEGTLIWGHIPVTEMIWGFSWGLVWGPIYEFMVGARTMSIKRIKV